jgi:predicted RNase H-like HicB family nuclease
MRPYVGRSLVSLIAVADNQAKSVVPNGLARPKSGPSFTAAAGGDRQMNLTVHLDREDDGRWIAEVPELPGVLVYGTTRDDAMMRAKVLSLRVLADRIEHGEPIPEADRLFTVTT